MSFRHIFLVAHVLLNSLVCTVTSRNNACIEPSNYDDVIAESIGAFYRNSSFLVDMSTLMRLQSVSVADTHQDKLVFETSPFETEHTCPWKWKMTYDPDRIPTNLVEAECLCEHCTVRSSSQGCGEKRESMGKCRLVVGPMLVVRKVCDSGRTNVYGYKAELQNVPLGCTCERPLLA